MPSKEIEKHPDRLWTVWNKDTKQYFIHITYKIEKVGEIVL